MDDVNVREEKKKHLSEANVNRGILSTEHRTIIHIWKYTRVIDRSIEI
jgi:hypothetical protein